MIPYLLKTVFCSGLLLLGYKLLLEQETFHHFKRFYLLLSLLLSLIVPLIEIEIGNSLTRQPDLSPLMDYREAVQTTTRIQYTGIDDRIPSMVSVTLLVYLLVTSLLLVRLVKNLIKLFWKISRNEKEEDAGLPVVLLGENVIPHSFLNYIFLNKVEFKEGKVENEILEHEKVHVRQKHSLDILFVEVLQTFFWFNPFLVFFKSSIKLNHEFLADAHVIGQYRNIALYQQLLLSKINSDSIIVPFCSELNYSIAKNRFRMMTRTTKPSTALCKLLLLTPLIAAVIFLFSTKVDAQDTVSLPQKPAKTVQSTKVDASPELLDEYNAIIAKYRTKDKRWLYNFPVNVSETDRNRLEAIYEQMSKAQQDKQTIAFRASPSPLPKVIPSQQQLESWKNAKVYGVWIDDKRVTNEILNKYTPDQFSQVFVSKLAKNAINYGKHYYQVNLMTNAYYEQYMKTVLADGRNQIAVRRFNIVKR